MIDIKPMLGNTKSGTEKVRHIDGVYRDNVFIGVCQKTKGGSVALHVTVSEAEEDMIRQAMDERDGGPHDRIVLLAPHDPRRKHGNQG